VTEAAASFDGVARVYDASRPSYPIEAVEWLVPQAARTVVDVGAGTGKFTRLLQRPGRTVIAVEPSQGMRSELAALLPDVPVREGSGESIPLPDAVADALVFAQAWHWVDPPAASAEAARVLRPGGSLGLVWNLRDERIEWMRQLGVAMRADGDHYRGAPEDPAVFRPFGGPERRFVEWVQLATRPSILDMVRSRSYFDLLPDPDKRATLRDVEEVLDRHPQTAGRAIELPYVTASFRYVRP
jgi:SAM-dependent methyltransferase